MAETMREEQVTSAEARHGLSPFAKAHVCLSAWATKESGEYIQKGVDGECEESNSLLEGEILQRLSSVLPKVQPH